MEASTNMRNIPSEVIRLIAGHGPVQVTTFSDTGGASAVCAPFEDILHLLLPSTSGTVKALLDSTRLEVSAKAEDGSYQIRMQGRAHAGRGMSGHPMLSVLEPWLPEGVSSHRLVVVPFVAEHIEFVRGQGEVVKRNVGLTPAGQERPTFGRMWMGAAFSGMAGVLGLWFIVAAALWFGAQGDTFAGRPLALALSLVSGLGLIGGVRLIVIAQGFLQWRRLRASRADAPYLSEGFFAPREARIGALIALSAALVALSTVGSIWGSSLVTRIVLGCGVWLCGPAWALHLAMGRPEPRR